MKRFFAGNLLLILITLTLGIQKQTFAQYNTMWHNTMGQSYQRAKANGKNLKPYLSYDIGISKPFAHATYTHTYLDMENGVIRGEKNIRRSLQAKGIGVNTSIYYPLFSVGDKSIVAFDFGIAGYLLHYDLGEIRLSPDKVYDYSLQSMQIGVPLCLDYKIGGEAIYDKSEKVTFTAGAGLCPVVYLTDLGTDISNIKGGFRPYVHAELGFFAFIEWKIKAYCMGGTANILNLNNENSGMEGMPENSNIKLKSAPVFSIGISFMPFSRDWDSGW
jgi:hypothetical protein